MVEEWKDIKGFEGFYQVSNTGKIKALERLVVNNGGLQHKHERILKHNISKSNSHCLVVLCKEGKTYPRLVHRLVAESFIPNPENKPNVDHIDTNPENNNVDNLRWVTQKENCNNPLTLKHSSEARKGHPYYGRPLTSEERKKISDALKGRKLTEEHKRKISEAHKGKVLSEAHRAKLSESLKGHPVSEETKIKIRNTCLITKRKGLKEYAI